MYPPFILAKVKNNVNLFCGIMFRRDGTLDVIGDHTRFWTIIG